jgi:predicted aconitase/predicted aconitase with swiveling domain
VRSSNEPVFSIVGRSIIDGVAEGDVLWTDTPLGFMGGVEPATGAVIDRHHPLYGKSVTGRILAIPSGRGSCAGSGVMLEMLHAKTAPAALIFHESETILPLGVMIGQEFLGATMPVIQITEDEFHAVSACERLRVADGTVIRARAGAGDLAPGAAGYRSDVRPASPPRRLSWSDEDAALARGDRGEAARRAIGIISRFAELEGADELIDVDMAHIDGCFYQGPAGLEFVNALVDLGARVVMPSTMNALRVDRERWRSQGVAPEIGVPSELMADAYVTMGVQPTYTCAPYLAGALPRRGQQIAWAESNAVVYANSVLGARTLKYPDYLDILVAITGRAPRASTHMFAARRATKILSVTAPPVIDDAYYSTLGYLVGKLSPNDIPAIIGLEEVEVSHDDLKSFGAAFATTSAAPMFHVVGVTPEATTLEAVADEVSVTRRIFVDAALLEETWRELNSATDAAVDLVALGNPHFSVDECARFADLCEGNHVAAGVSLVVTCSRDTLRQIRDSGVAERIEAAGGSIVTDTCWCLIGAPIVPQSALTTITNSGKYAHYGPNETGRPTHLRSLEDCAEAAWTGVARQEPPAWLRR